MTDNGAQFIFFAGINLRGCCLQPPHGFAAQLRKPLVILVHGTTRSKLALKAKRHKLLFYPLWYDGKLRNEASEYQGSEN